MKKLLTVLATLALIAGVGVMKAEAASEDTITITVTMQKLEVVLEIEDTGDPYVSWAVDSPIAPSTSDEMIGGEGVLVKNTSNVTVDIEGWSDDNDTTTTGWDPGTAAGNKVYKLEAADFATAQTTPSYTTTVVLDNTSSPGDDIETGLAGGADRYVYLKFTSPSETADDGTQHTITVTLAVTAS